MIRYLLLNTREPNVKQFHPKHVFKCEVNEDGEIIRIEPKSICGFRKQSEMKRHSNYQTSPRLRVEAAKIGRMVCGVCISHFYLDPE